MGSYPGLFLYYRVYFYIINDTRVFIFSIRRACAPDLMMSLVVAATGASEPPFGHSPAVPWTTPVSFEGAALALLRAAPGIWTGDAFLSEHEVSGVMALLPPTGVACLFEGFDHTCWGRCKGNAHDQQLGKLCSNCPGRRVPWPIV